MKPFPRDTQAAPGAPFPRGEQKGSCAPRTLTTAPRAALPPRPPGTLGGGSFFPEGNMNPDSDCPGLLNPNQSSEIRQSPSDAAGEGARTP